MEGVKKMTTHSISYYENRFKEAIMNGLLAEEGTQLQVLLNNLIQENEKDSININNAYLNVKREIAG